MTSKYVQKPENLCYNVYSEVIKKCPDEIGSSIISHHQAQDRYKIPRWTFLNILRNGHQLEVGSQLAFTPHEESSFVAFLIQMVNYKFPVIMADVSSIISCSLQKIGRKVDKFKHGIHQRRHWIEWFLEKNKELSLRFASYIKAMSSGSAIADIV